MRHSSLVITKNTFGDANWTSTFWTYMVCSKSINPLGVCGTLAATLATIGFHIDPPNFSVNLADPHSDCHQCGGIFLVCRWWYENLGVTSQNALPWNTFLSSPSGGSIEAGGEMLPDHHALRAQGYLLETLAPREARPRIGPFCSSFTMTRS